MHQGKHNEEKPLPSTVFCLKPQRSVIAAHIISSQQHAARNCSARFVNAERSPWYGLKSKLPPLNPAWLLLERCDADAVSQSRLEEGAASAHQHDGIRFFVVYCQPAHSVAFGESRAFSRHVRGQRPHSLVC